MRSHAFIYKKVLALLLAIIVVAICLPSAEESYADSSNLLRFCSYATYPVRSVNYDCDGGIKHHVVIGYNDERWGPAVTPNQYTEYGIGVSYVALLSGEAVYITSFGTHVMDPSENS